MNPDNGRLVMLRDDSSEVAQAAAMDGYTIQVRRELTRREKDKKQIRMYSPCGCGSGKKFKFCCWTGKAKVTR